MLHAQLALIPFSTPTTSSYRHTQSTQTASSFFRRPPPKFWLTTSPSPLRFNLPTFAVATLLLLAATASAVSIRPPPVSYAQPGMGKKAQDSYGDSLHAPIVVRSFASECRDNKRSCSPTNCDACDRCIGYCHFAQKANKYEHCAEIFNNNCEAPTF